MHNIESTHTTLPICIHSISCLFHVGHGRIRRLWSKACRLVQGVERSNRLAGLV